MFTPFQKLIPKTLTKLGIKNEAEAALICRKYRQLAPALLHEQALAFTFPKSFRNKTLVIGVTSGAWSSQIMAKKEALIKGVNEALGSPYVKSIKTEIVEEIPA